MLNAFDWLIIAIYLAVCVVAGILSRGKQDDAADYFTAGGSLGGMLGSVMVGLSIAATLFSGISFLAYPSLVYSAGLDILAALAIFPLAWVVLRYWFLPRYLAAGYRDPYEIFERRFGPHVRTVAAVMFALLRVGWMAALIYAPTVAVMAAGDLGPQWFWPLVLIIGLSSTIYTTLGGIRGVIVTDAIQFLVIVAGIGLTIGYVLFNLPVPISDAWRELGDQGRLTWFDPSLDFTKTLTVWSVLIGSGVGAMGSYLADQMSLQRYMAVGKTGPASRAFAINVVGVILVLVMLAMVGLALRSWYQHVQDPNLPQQIDKIFPYFVATQLPSGLAGLLLAAILAATMSSMTSGINALAATITLDLRMRLIDLPLTAAQQVRFAKWMSLVIGVLATLCAGLVGRLGTIFDISQALLGVFLGPLLAAILLAMAAVRLSSRTVIASLVLGCVAGWCVAFSPASSLWVAPAAFAGSMAVVGLAGLAALRPATAKRDAATSTPSS